MAPLLRRRTHISCFFCQSLLDPTPLNPNSFKCPQCDCWNRYNSKGEIMADEPAMRDESLNRRSFARRASPRKDRLPSTFGSAPFCNTCQSNQRLIMNLLSSYLPSSDGPDYERRLETYDEYEASVHKRYRPVCERCQPLVEEEIRKNDALARSKVLGGWLRVSNPSQKRIPRSLGERAKMEKDIRLWKVRGMLCLTTLGLVLAGDSAGALRYQLPQSSRWTFAIRSFPLLVLLSILWTMWEPTWARLRRDEFQGRKSTVEGKGLHRALQLVAWLKRLIISILLAASTFNNVRDYLEIYTEPPSTFRRALFASFLTCELSIAIYSYSSLHFSRSPSIRLIDDTYSRPSTPSSTHSSSGFPASKSASLPRPSSSRSSAPPIPSYDDDDSLLDSLSFSSSHTPHASSSTRHLNPIFGVPSFGARASSKALSEPPMSGGPYAGGAGAGAGAGEDEDDDDMDLIDEDPDAMDWQPTTPARLRGANGGGGGGGGFQSPISPLSFRTGMGGSWAAWGNGNGNGNGNGGFDQATGLENLLARTNLADLDGSGGFGGGGGGSGRWGGGGGGVGGAGRGRGRMRRQRGRGGRGQEFEWRWVYVASLVPLTVAAYFAWRNVRGTYEY